MSEKVYLYNIVFQTSVTVSNVKFLSSRVAVHQNNKIHVSTVYNYVVLFFKNVKSLASAT